MALSPEDLAQLGEFIEGKVKDAVAAQPAPAAPVAEPAVNDEAQNQPENQPDYWVHLADGSVFKSKDSQSSHMVSPSSGISEVVLGHFPAGVE